MQKEKYNSKTRYKIDLSLDYNAATVKVWLDKRVVHCLQGPWRNKLSCTLKHSYILQTIILLFILLLAAGPIFGSVICYYILPIV